MARLIYSVIASLDGYIEDEAGRFDWAAPDEDVQPPDLEVQPAHVREFAELWQAAEKVVYSRTLDGVSGARTRIEREFDPEAVRELKATARGDLTVGGPELAAQAIEAGLVDELQLFIVPVLVGGGKSALPHSGARVDLELVDEHRFAGGSVFLRYRAGAAS